jgi:hypothetical protein
MSSNILGSENQIELVRGSSKTYELEVLDEDGTAVDITGSRVVLTVKCSATDRSPLIQKDSAAGVAQVELTAPREGKAAIKFVPSDTQTLDVGKYIFDVWVVLVSGFRSPVIMPSPFIIQAGVTVLT